MGTTFLRHAAAACLLAAVTAAPAAVPVTINYNDAAGVGFNDATLGAARKSAFQFAVNIWANQLNGTVPVVVNATFPGLGGTSVSAVLGQAGFVDVVKDYTNAPLAGTWYPAPLANQYFGSDVSPANADINAQFNADVDNNTVLGTTSFYYGTDSLPGSNVDFKSVVLHELGHGLGFAGLINSSNGQWAAGDPDVFSRQLTRTSVGNFDTMNDAQRLAALTSDQVFWKGAQVVAAKSGQVKMYCPATFQAGSSLSHWDTSNTPDLLMEPFDTGPKATIDLTKQAFQDIGWTFASSVEEWGLY